MAKSDREKLQAQVRQLGRYTDEDLSPSKVEHRDALVAAALEDKTVAAKLLKTFERVVDKVPSEDRVTIVRWVGAVFITAIVAFTVLKATGKW